MRKAAPPTPKPVPPQPEPVLNFYFVIASILTFFVPVLVLPYILDNAFNTPKTVLMLLGVCLMAAVYSIRLSTGKEVSITRSSVPKLMILVILLNFFSFSTPGTLTTRTWLSPCIRQSCFSSTSSPFTFPAEPLSGSSYSRL